jgi:hypothetical protein
MSHDEAQRHDDSSEDVSSAEEEAQPLPRRSTRLQANTLLQGKYKVYRSRHTNHRKRCVKTARKGIRNILDSGALCAEHASKLTDKQRKESITSFLFGKRKLSGELKGRMVENRKQLQKRPEYQNLFSTTSNPLTTMTHLTVASHQ